MNLLINFGAICNVIKDAGFECGGTDVLKIIRFAWIFVDMIFTFIPIGLVVMVILDFFKNVMAGKED